MAYFECLLSQSSGGGGAVLTVTCDSALSGATISCTDGTTTLTAVCPSSSPYEVEFNIPNSGTWTISGLTFSTSVVVTLDYEVELGGLNYRAWLTAGGLDPSDYASLSAVLADEKAIRQLFLVHASVDYLASVTASDASVETIIEDNYCAKWINESDYALFTLYDNAVIADLMDEADKYFYGEWGIVDSTTTPPTWGAKGNIPVMTSNTAPYGEASAVGSHSSQPAYMAFDGTTSTQGTMGNAVNNYFRYRFVNPVKAKKARVAIGDTNKYVIKASNDGTTWDTISEEFTGTGGTSYFDVPLTANTYYLQYELVETVKLTSASYTSLQELQIYGHTLKVSVPTMTSNTAPYGEVSATTPYNSSFVAYNAFNNNNNGYLPLTTDAFLAYTFTTKIKPIMCKVTRIGSGSDAYTYIVKGYDDSSEKDTISEAFSVVTGATAFINLSSNKAYKTLELSSSLWGTQGSGLKLQFYGLDYSEKEFEPNTNRKWLYDHGVYPTNNNLEESTDWENSPYVSRGDITELGGMGYRLVASTQAASYKTLVLANSEDLSSNNLLRMRNNIHNVYGADACLDISSVLGSNYISVESFSSQGGVPGSALLVTSAKHSTPEIARKNGNGNDITLTELWLE